MKKAAKKEQKQKIRLAEKAKEQQFLEALLTFPVDEEELRAAKPKVKKGTMRYMTAEQQDAAFASGVTDYLRIHDYCEDCLTDYVSEQSFIRSVVLNGKFEFNVFSIIHDVFLGKQSSKWCPMQKMLMNRDKAKLKRYAKILQEEKKQKKGLIDYHRKRSDAYHDRDVSKTVKFFFSVLSYADDDVLKWDEFVLAEMAEGVEESQIEKNDLDYMRLVLKNYIPEC